MEQWFWAITNFRGQASAIVKCKQSSEDFFITDLGKIIHESDFLFYPSGELACPIEKIELLRFANGLTIARINDWEQLVNNKWVSVSILDNPHIIRLKRRAIEPDSLIWEVEEYIRDTGLGKGVNLTLEHIKSAYLAGRSKPYIDKLKIM